MKTTKQSNTQATKRRFRLRKLGPNEVIKETDLVFTDSAWPEHVDWILNSGFDPSPNDVGSTTAKILEKHAWYTNRIFRLVPIRRIAPRPRYRVVLSSDRTTAWLVDGWMGLAKIFEADYYDQLVTTAKELSDGIERRVKFDDFIGDETINDII